MKPFIIYYLFIIFIIYETYLYIIGWNANMNIFLK